MNIYNVKFYKIDKEADEKDKGKLKPTGKLEFVGEVNVDDTGTNNSFPLLAKAFRHANGNCLSADKVVVSKLV